MSSRQRPRLADTNNDLNPQCDCVEVHGVPTENECAKGASVSDPRSEGPLKRLRTTVPAPISYYCPGNTPKAGNLARPLAGYLGTGLGHTGASGRALYEWAEFLGVPAEYECAVICIKSEAGWVHHLLKHLPSEL